MSSEVILRKGTASQHASFTGAAGELSYVTDTGQVAIHDEVNPGGRTLVTTGFVDYNDLATATTPIALTVAGTPYKLTNDGAGSFTLKTYKPVGHGEVWDTSGNLFDLSDHRVGDTLDFRIDTTVTTSGANREIDITLDMAIGGSAPFTVDVGRATFKSAGTYNLVQMYTVYIGSADVLNNGAAFYMSCDTTGTTVQVNGWFVRSTLR